MKTIAKEIFNSDDGWKDKGTVNGRRVFDMPFTSKAHNGLIRAKVDEARNYVSIEILHGNDRVCRACRLDPKELDKICDQLADDFDKVTEVRAMLDQRKTTRKINGRTITCEHATRTINNN